MRDVSKAGRWCAGVPAATSRRSKRPLSVGSTVSAEAPRLPVPAPAAGSSVVIPLGVAVCE